MQLKEVEPFAAHCTFQISANMGKRNRMREAMIFEDEPEYYAGEPPTESGGRSCSCKLHG